MPNLCVNTSNSTNRPTLCDSECPTNLFYANSPGTSQNPFGAALTALNVLSFRLIRNKNKGNKHKGTTCCFEAQPLHVLRNPNKQQSAKKTDGSSYISGVVFFFPKQLQLGCCSLGQCHSGLTAVFAPKDPKQHTAVSMVEFAKSAFELTEHASPHHH